MSQKPKLTEEERLAKLRKLDNTPSPTRNTVANGRTKRSTSGSHCRRTQVRSKLAWMIQGGSAGLPDPSVCAG